MDFIEAKHVAAREIALALGVPPMLLAIPGDNTYSNYQEATRSFWRQTVLPLVNRTAKALSSWLSPAFGGLLELRPDHDAIEALNIEREALWTRVDKATFLTQNEKRAAVGYGPIEVSDPPGLTPALDRQPAQKFNPHHDALGRFTFAPDGGDASESNPNDANVVLVGGKLDALRKFGKLTAQEFASRFCKGSIKGELPGEFKDVAIEDIINIARGGDHRAKTCLKLLGRKEYRK